MINPNAVLGGAAIALQNQVTQMKRKKVFAANAWPFFNASLTARSPLSNGVLGADRLRLMQFMPSNDMTIDQ
ncbi:MAG: hypothetical protein VXW65_01975, partial [Pseudomonadota bacterium]|nr:hypothetical protein [Pseudomonadota bacterium]